MGDGEMVWTDLAACRGQGDTFFPERYTADAILAARVICASCPVYDECRAWGTASRASIPEGILFGFTDYERRQMSEGTLPYSDWRFGDWERPVSKKRLAAKEREARKVGVPEVVNAYRLYDFPPEQRKAVIEAYRQWQNDQQFPATFEQALMAAERAATREKKLRLSRPSCPNGCGPEHVMRYRTNAAGHKGWQCFRCRAKMWPSVDRVGAGTKT